MGLFTKKEKEEKMLMIHYEGIPNYKPNLATYMTLDVDSGSLKFKSPVLKDLPEVELPFNKITNAGPVNVTEIEKQSKIGRAAVGGLLFGEAGAIVGALSAGEKKKTKSLYIINYISNGEEKAIVMKENGNLNFLKFQKHLLELIPQKKTPPNITL